MFLNKKGRPTLFPNFINDERS